MMKEMKTRKNLIIGMAMLGIVCVGVGAATTKPLSANAATQGLTGFSSPGASVFIATDGTNTQQMRFQVNLASTAEETYKTAAAAQNLQSGVVVLPYDIYKAQGYTELTKDTAEAVTADVTKNWETNGDGYQSYAYLPVDLIPTNQYNRKLIARGYVEVGENVYYTDPVYASMAYVAWKNIGMAEGAYDDTLNGYRGPYTLTYGAGEKIENLYYGDTFYSSLPKTINDYNVVGWYWDEARTEAIKETDYATGTMPVYYKLQEFTVSGTVSGVADLTTVKIAVDGVDTDATVDSNGKYSVSVLPGTHKFTFYCPGYKVYVNTEVSGDCTLGNAELLADYYEIGKFGIVENTPGLVAENNFSGKYTITGNNYLLSMPNTATTDDFTYTVKVSGLTAGRGDKAFAASVSNGAWALSIGCYQWETIVVNLSSKAGAAYVGYYNLSGTQQYIDGATIKIVRTESDIKVYIVNTLYFTFTSTGMTPADGVTDRNWGDSFVKNQAKLAGFFGENVKLACGIAALNGDTFTTTYECNVAKHVAVSGTISGAAAEVDLATTTLKVDGIVTPITVNAEGAYTASVPEGTHTLTFENGDWIKTQEVTVVNGSNTVNVALVYATWRAGNYGSVKSTTTPAYNENGEYTISGTDQLVLFPNTARSDSFTYRVDVSNVTRAVDASTIGICLTDGNYKLVVTYRAQRNTTKTAFSFDLSTVSAFDTHAVFATTEQLSEEFSLKLVVTKESIKFYYGEDRLIFTITKDSFASTVKNVFWSTGKLITSVNGALTEEYTKRISGFFAEGAKIAVGINSGLQGDVKATYQCSITNN